MSHPEKCPLCDQEDETIDHLLISCVFVRQFWFAFLSQVNLQGISPQPNDRSFLDWWRRSNLVIVDTTRGLNLMFILGAWVLWKHRNRCVFETVVPSLAAALSQAREERVMWELVGGGGDLALERSPVKSSPLRLLNVHLIEVICSYPCLSRGPQSSQVIVARLMGLKFEPHVVGPCCSVYVATRP
jgi:hypothetical protein